MMTGLERYASIFGQSSLEDAKSLILYHEGAKSIEVFERHYRQILAVSPEKCANCPMLADFAIWVAGGKMTLGEAMEHKNILVADCESGAQLQVLETVGPVYACPSELAWLEHQESQAPLSIEEMKAAELNNAGD